MTDNFCFLRLRAPGRDAGDMAGALLTDTLPVWRTASVAIWGIWRGLFGIASNELLVMAAGAGEHPLADLEDALPDQARLVEALPLTSTVRPQGVEPLTSDGLYVFRWFAVRPEDCDEIVALSSQAWETFEGSDRYASQPRGLFRPRSRLGAQRMLLVTWYDGFASWETSRTPAPQASENFRRRHALTGGTVAYATRLVENFVPR